MYLPFVATLSSSWDIVKLGGRVSEYLLESKILFMEVLVFLGVMVEEH